MKWNASQHGNQSIGGYAEARDPSGVVDFIARRSRLPRALAVRRRRRRSATAGDDLQTDDRRVRRRRRRPMNDGTRRVIVSNEVGLLRATSSSSTAPRCPSFGASFGNEWDLLTASMGEVTAAMQARGREAAHRRGAGAIAHAPRPELHGPAASRRATARTWPAGSTTSTASARGPGVSESTRSAMADGASSGTLTGYVDWLSGGRAALGRGARSRSLRASSGICVFNPLVVDAHRLRRPRTSTTRGAAPRRRPRDRTRGAEPRPVTVDGAPARAHPRRATCRPVGYRVYEVRPGAGADASRRRPRCTLPSVQTTLYGVTARSRAAS